MMKSLFHDTQSFRNLPFFNIFQQHIHINSPESYIPSVSMLHFGISGRLGDTVATTEPDLFDMLDKVTGT